MADVLDIAAVVVHHKKLQGRRGMLGCPKSIAVADKDNLAAGQRTRAHIEHTIIEIRLALFPLATIARPIGGASVGRVDLLREANDFFRLHMNAIDVGPTERRLTMLTGSFEAANVN